MKNFFLLPIHFAVQIYKKISKVVSYPTITVEYPYVLKPIVKLARVQIDNNFNECTGCKKCEELCPVKAITIVSELYLEQVKRPKNSKGQPFFSAVSQFQIDYSKCVYCGICISSCPADSLTFDRMFSKPHYHIQALKTDLVHIPRSMRRDESL